MRDTRFSRAFLLILLVLITVLFLAMVRGFLLTILLAAIIAGLAHPLYRRLEAFYRGRRGAASFTVVVIVLLVVILPLMLLAGLVAGQALEVTQLVRPWVSSRLEQPDLLMESLRGTPLYEQLAPYREPILRKAGELVGTAGSFLVESVGAGTRGTVVFFFHFFILLYTLYFLLMDGGRMLRRIFGYLPLGTADRDRMLDKFTSVTRATLKGTLLVGITQGGLAAAAFWVVGIPGVLFWGTVMTLLSIIPGIGTALVWVPAAGILLATGKIWQGVFLIVFCGLVVGSADNLMRPRLVGRDTRMHELLILFGTLGGLVLFGVVGFIVGPVLAALFVTIWDIYGHAFRDLLPADDGEPETGP